jgi:hypothetical protein
MHIALEPLDFIARLGALVPKPGVNLTRFHGVFAPNYQGRGGKIPGKKTQTITMLKIVKWFGRVAIVVVSIVLTIMVVRAFDARRLPDLQPWHTAVFTEEYRVTSTDSNLSLKEFLEREDRLFEELSTRVDVKPRDNPDAILSRYVMGSRAYPGRFTRNWNRSYELIPDNPKGGVVLLHGLTDSPYSMRAIAEIFHSQGFYVLVPRLPGHGTTPSALRSWSNIRWSRLSIAALPGLPSTRADWINLTGSETAPNIAEIYVLDDHVKLVLEVYVGDLKTFEELIPDGWLKELGGHQLDSINGLPVATRQWSKAIISTHGM